MGVTQSALIVILLAILICFIHTTEHQFFYSMSLLFGYAFALYKILPLMKIANMEESGTILVCGLFGLCLLDMAFLRMKKKR